MVNDEKKLVSIDELKEVTGGAELTSSEKMKKHEEYFNALIEVCCRSAEVGDFFSENNYFSEWESLGFPGSARGFLESVYLMQTGKHFPLGL